MVPGVIYPSSRAQSERTIALARVALAALMEGGTELPERLPSGGQKPSEDILAQLSALAPQGSNGIDLAI